MAATTTVPASKSYLCSVQYDLTANYLTVSVVGKEDRKCGFSLDRAQTLTLTADESALLAWLSSEEGTREESISVNDMKLLASIRDRLLVVDVTAEPEAEPEIEEPEWIPTCPQTPAHGQMIRNQSGSGWRCACQGNRWLYREKRWSRCQGVIWDHPRSTPVQPAVVAPVVSQTPQNVTQTTPVAAPTVKAAAPVVVDQPKVEVTAPVVAQPSPAVTEQVSSTVDMIDRRVSGRVRGFGQDLTEADLNQLQKTCRLLEGNIYRLEYDLPVDGEVKNPSPWLWRYAVRSSESIWILTEESLKAAPVQQFIRDCEAQMEKYPNTECWVSPEHEDTRLQISLRCHRRLCDKLVEIHTSLIRSIAGADLALSTVQAAFEETQRTGGVVTENDQVAAQRTRDQGVRGAISRAAKTLDICIECAQVYDDTGEVSDLIQARREVIRAQRDAYNAQAEVRGACLSRVAI